MIGFKDQSVIVTGAGRGLGRLYALDLASRGAKVVVNDLGSTMSGDGTDASVAEAVVKEIEAAGGTAVASTDSVDNPDGGAAIVQTAVDAFGRLDALVSNAGIYEMLPFEELSVEQWRRMLQVHLDGAFYVTQPAFRAMKEQGYGRLVMVASNIGAFGSGQAAHYSAAKSGVIGLTNSLADAGLPYGIKANAVLPVGRTRMMTDSVADHEPNPVMDALFEETTAERVVPLVTYLASSACELTHHNISAVAGRFARVFMGLGGGWMADRSTGVTAEHIADNIDAITAPDPYDIPLSVSDELVAVLTRLGII